MKKMTIEELAAMPHETLNRMAVEGEISWSEWIDAQPESYAGYDTWLKMNGYTRTDNAALMYIRKCEQDLMEGEMPGGMADGAFTVEELREKIIRILE